MLTRPRPPSPSRYRPRLFALLVVLAGLGLLPAPAVSQGLADFDYENLRFRGVMADVGYIYPNRVEPTRSFGGRADLGFLGPGVRAVLGFNRWSSTLTVEEVGRLEERVEALIRDQVGEDVSVDLGVIEWSDMAIHGDVHVVWRVPFGVLTYAGLGGSAHILRGSGAAISDTFVEDLLDSVSAGINAHTGVEIPLHRRFRIVGEGRYELMQNLRYGQLRVGGQFTFGPLAPGEG